MLSPFFVLFYFLHGNCIFCRKLSVRKVTEYYRPLVSWHQEAIWHKIS